MTRTKALVLLIVFVFAGALYADVRVITLSNSVSDQARESLALSRHIQANRRDLFLADCVAENRRHRSTVRVIDRLFVRAAARVPSSRLAQLHASQAATMLVINQLAPSRNCAAFAAKTSAKR